MEVPIPTIGPHPDNYYKLFMGNKNKMPNLRGENTADTAYVPAINTDKFPSTIKPIYAEYLTAKPTITLKSRSPSF